MSVNKAKGNMYEGVYTWNPIQACGFKCKYCWVDHIPGYPKKVTYTEKCLSDNLGTGRTIFVCSTSDIGGHWVDKEYRSRIFEHCRQYDNEYLFQTKRPWAFLEYIPHLWTPSDITRGELPRRSIIGTTIETNRDTRLISKAPSPAMRAIGLAQVMAADSSRRYKYMVSVEPVLDFDQELSIWLTHLKPDYVSIGADSKNHHLKEPSAEKLFELIGVLRAVDIEVRIKDNLHRILYPILGLEEHEELAEGKGA